MGKEERQRLTSDYQVMMPRQRPPHQVPPRGWWILLAIVVALIVAWRIVAYVTR